MRADARREPKLRKRIKAIRNVGAVLAENPEALSLEELRRAFEATPDTIPLERRIVALIIGVPTPGEQSP